MRSSADHKYPPLQLASGQEPNISHLRIFSCAVYVPIAPPQRTKIGNFPSLGGEKKTHEKDVSWSEPSLLHLDPRTKQNTKRVTKSHIPADTAPARLELPNKQAGNNIAQESQKRLKRGRPIGSKDKNPRKRKGTEKNSDHDENILDETQDIKTSPEEEMNDMNKEMSINYRQTNILWDRNEIRDIDEIFSYSVASDIMSGDDDPEPKSVIDCQNRPDWDRWKDAMQAELNSLNKRRVFGPIVTTPRDVKHVGRGWIFVQKRNKKNEVTRYKGRLVAQAVYIDDLNIIVTNKEINKVVMHLKEEFEMKNLDKVKSLSTPMVGRSLNVDNDTFRPCEEGEDVLGPEVPHLNAIGALMYLTNCTRPDISFAVNLLARFRLIGYADTGYLSDPHKARSQTGYVFLNGGTAISWCSQKQTLVSTSSNHDEVIALHEASRECVWLRSMTQLIVTYCGLNKEKSPTIIHEDNAAFIAQMKEGYIKSDPGSTNDVLILLAEIDDPNITMEEYIKLKAEKDCRRDFPAIVYENTLAIDHEISSKPTVSPLDDNRIEFRVSFDESDDEDYTCIYEKNLFSYKLVSVKDFKVDLKNDNDEVNMSSNNVVFEHTNSGIDTNSDTQSHELDEDLETNHDPKFFCGKAHGCYFAPLRSTNQTEVLPMNGRYQEAEYSRL
uniref:Reverse transcriptase Ty1/copia-type domain-containing protein n=1 Tax=Tanacetum cinerariifolium TaxID=118510 RepID=A0A6L2KKG5_TANCI|nr:hypothetical protein [Tanacetum cinerariifolium]